MQGLLVACVILLVVLAVALALPPRCRRRGDGFEPEVLRNYRHGVTCGVMPSIETTCDFGNGLCAGAFGVPP
jgi:hypothetical protein